MARFGLLCLELVKWSLAGCRDSMGGRENMIAECLKISGLTLSNPHLTSALALPTNTSWAVSSVISLTDYVMVRLPHLQLPSLPYPALLAAVAEPGASPTLVASTCLARLLVLLEQAGPSPPSQLEAAIQPIICLARLPQFSPLARAPPLAFSLGWQPDITGSETGGNLPQELLQETEVLTQFIWRINMLGWTSKTQFEETWMILLSVLNQDHVMSQSSALVVSAITSLLVNTLALPVAGIPGARILHHPRDSPHYSLLSGRGQQLTEIQNILTSRLEDSGTAPWGPTALPVDSSVNLERASCVTTPALVSWAGYSPVPVAGYGAGQVSLSFLKTCMAYHDSEGEAQDRQSLASSVLPLFLLLREENLAAAGLDTHSCTHFLTDLFSQWLAGGGQDTPLVVLTAAVRAMLMISDIFTQETQFVWMLSVLSDLYKVHPAEDELLTELLVLGISKAVSVVGFLEPDLYDRLRKGLESGLRSGQLSSRAACVHSLLYLLQRDGVSPETPGLFLLAIEHLKANMLGGRVMSDTVDINYSLLLWSLLFFTLENCEPDLLERELSEALTQVAITAAGQAGQHCYTTVLAGLERLVVGGLVRGRMLERLVSQVTDLMTDWPPVTLLPALQLFLAAMYCSHPLSPASPTTLSDPETLMAMMEQMSILFDCVRRSGPAQAELLAEILPQVLIDFFPASDVVNRVISEFISPGQPHPALLAGVLKMIFLAAASQQDQQIMLTQWVLVSHSIWRPSCFFMAASSKPWLQAMFPHLQHNQPTYQAPPLTRTGGRRRNISSQSVQ